MDLDPFQKLCRVNSELHNRHRPVSLKNLVDILGCTDKTVRNIIERLRGLGAPIEYSRKDNGYYLDSKGYRQFEVPALWFNSSELYALLTSHHLLAELQPGVLQDYMESLTARIEKVFDQAANGFKEINNRVRIFQAAARPTNLQHFQKAATALIERRKLKILYRGRKRDEISERIISPQRLVYYRSNWYLDAWCHQSNGIRTFSIDRMHTEITSEVADEVSDTKLDDHFTHTFGIFAGDVQGTAVMRFSGEATKWVADEQWHPKQEYRQLPDGGCELKIPYGDPTELIMEILKYGPDVEVLAPPSLRNVVAQRVQEMAAIYSEHVESPYEGTGVTSEAGFDAVSKRSV